MTEIKFTQSSASNGVSVCTNLRPSSAGDSLTVASLPSAALDGGWLPLLALDDTGTRVLVARDHDVGVCDGTSVTLLGRAFAEVVCAVADSSSMIIVMTAEGAEYLSCGAGTYVWLGRKPEFPPVRFEAQRKGSLSVPVALYTFADIDLSASPAAVSASDVKAYSSLLRKAYSSLSFTATASRLWIQPVMVRAFYLDGAGDVLHACAPLIVGLPSGWQGLGVRSVPLIRRGTAGADVAAWVLSADCYSITVRCDFSELPAAWRCRVARVSISVSPQIHPFGTAADSLMAWRVDNPRTETPTLTFTLPGATSDFSSLDEARLSEVAVMTARMFDAASSADFFGTFPEGTHSLAPYRSVTPSEEMADLAAGARKAIATTGVDTRMAELTAPHSFSAACGGNIGVWQMWGSVTPRLYKGFRPCDMAVTNDKDAPVATSTVRLTDSDGHSRTLERTSLLPAALSPMLAYPHPGATAVTIGYTTASDAFVAQTFTLRPVPGTVWSVCLNHNLASVSPGDFPVASPGSTVIDSGVMDIRADSLAVTSRGSWMRPLSVTSCGNGTVTALTPACRAGAGLDTGKTPSCIFATSGIYVAGISAKGVIDSPRRIDTRPVLSTRHVAFSPEGIYVAAASALLRIRGNLSATMLCGFHSAAMAVRPDCNDLWYTDRQGNTCLLSLSSLATSTLTLPVQPVALTAIGSRLWITAYDTLMFAPEAGAPAPDDTAFSWEGRFRYGAARLPEKLVIDMSAVWFTGDIELAVDWGGTPVDFMRLAVDGPVNAPVVEYLVTPRGRWARLMNHPWYTIRLRGTATGLHLRSIRFE